MCIRMIEEEKITCDLGGQAEVLRRLCTWLELWAELDREHFMLTLTKKWGHRWTCLGSDEETDGARGQGVVGEEVRMEIRGQIVEED